MRHLRILLDLDGTVLQNAGRRVAERSFGIRIPEDQYGEPLSSMLGLSREQFWSWWHENQEEIYSQAFPLPGAREAVAALRSTGAYVAVVTARRSSAEAVTAAWLAREGFPYDTMIMDADDKVSAAKRLDLNLGFEDDPCHALPLAELFPMVLINGNKNRGADLEHPRLHRIAGWSEALPLLHRLQAQTA